MFDLLKSYIKEAVIKTKHQLYLDSLSDEEKFRQKEKEIREPYIDSGKNFDFDKKIFKTLSLLRKKFQEKYGNPIGVGRQRETFRYKSWVFKVPINRMGMDSNIKEHKYKEKNNVHEFPITKLFFLKDIPILKMEYVEYLDSKDKPDWSGCIDCGQVGKTKKGKIVPYDYGY